MGWDLPKMVTVHQAEKPVVDTGNAHANATQPIGRGCCCRSLVSENFGRIHTSWIDRMAWRDL